MSNKPYTFYDALIEVCESKSQAIRIFRCLSQEGIIQEIEKDHGSLDLYSNKVLYKIKNFGPISLIFARRANKRYMEEHSHKRQNNAYPDTIPMHPQIISGEELKSLQQKSGISVLALSRLTGLSRASIYRAFKNEALDSYNLLIWIALNHPNILVYTSNRK